MLAIIGLRVKEKLVHDNVALIAANLALAREFFAEHSATFAFHEPAAGSVGFARLTTGEPIQQFCQRLVEDAGRKPCQGLENFVLRSKTLTFALCLIANLCCRLWSSTFCAGCSVLSLGQPSTRVVLGSRPSGKLGGNGGIAGVLLLPADVYEHDASVARGCFRLGLGRKNFSVCLEAFDVWLASERAQAFASAPKR